MLADALTIRLSLKDKRCGRGRCRAKNTHSAVSVEHAFSYFFFILSLTSLGYLVISQSNTAN